MYQSKNHKIRGILIIISKIINRDQILTFQIVSISAVDYTTLIFLQLSKFYI
jgi:hypothetical protein